MRPASGFILDESLYSAENPHSFETRLQDVEIRVPRHMGGFQFLWRASTLPLWPLLAVCVGLVAMALLCSQHRVQDSEAGAPRRRLAGEDGDPFSSPPSPELEQLCSSLGPWVPAEPSPGGTRQSPRIVEKFFEEMETDEQGGMALPVPEEATTTETVAGAAISGSEAGPSAPSPGGSYDERPGPSSRFTTVESLLRMPQHPLPPSNVSARPAVSSSKAPLGTARRQRTKRKPASGGLMPVSGVEPSTSTATPPLPPSSL